ncbi:MAG: hypothetical protein IJ265_05635 [Oscillospiraceae bacterium]|nr:hypothetical protein [Oscillospiraceae bacterium]
MSKKNRKRTLAGTVRFCEYKLMMGITGAGFAAVLVLLMHTLLNENISFIGVPAVAVMLVFLLLLLIVFLCYARFSILYSEKHRTLIVNTLLSHRVFSISDITSIQPQEIRCTFLPTVRGSSEVHDEQADFLLIRCGRHAFRVNQHSEGAEQFFLFLRNNTSPTIWKEASRIRIWNLLDLLFFSDDDPWEIARKEQKRKKKAK